MTEQLSNHLILEKIGSSKLIKVIVPPKRAILISDENSLLLEQYKDDVDYTISMALNRALDELRELKTNQRGHSK
ncbi:hypothetical protein CEE45_01465 [Candidatus Heimdallarchaeota archaeon B3_Heim]|nr:MAG: hypothetical protein CEE45_01465 [Candidatus Heimdallarchaeota archaeon B3_Heim]